jgi:KaiC/GvpD/RAD55 family RecA-like ATPase
MARGKKRPKEKHPVELTDDEAMEHLFSKEVRDEAKRVARNARKADRNGKRSPHK